MSVSAKLHEIAVWKKQLRRSRKARDLREEGRLCSCIGHLYEAIELYDQALRYHQRDFQLSKEASDPKDQALACGNVARCFSKLQRYDEAFKHHQLHILLAQKGNSLDEEQRAYCDMGNTHLELSSQLQYPEEELEKAKLAYENSLQVLDRPDYRSSDRNKRLCDVYTNLGNIWDMADELDKALHYLLQAFELAERDQDLTSLARVCTNIGVVYMNKGDLSQAIKYMMRDLQLSHQLKDTRAQCLSLHNLGLAYMKLKDYEKALDYFRQHDDSVQRIFSEDEEALEKSKDQLTLVKRLIRCRDEASQLRKSLPSLLHHTPLSQVDALQRLSSLYQELNNTEESIACAERAYVLLSSLPSTEPAVLKNLCNHLGESLESVKRSTEAVKYHELELSLLDQQDEQDDAERGAILCNLANAAESASEEFERVLLLYEEALACATRADDEALIMNIMENMEFLLHKTGKLPERHQQLVEQLKHKKRLINEEEGRDVYSKEQSRDHAHSSSHSESETSVDEKHHDEDDARIVSPAYSSTSVSRTREISLSDTKPSRLVHHRSSHIKSPMDTVLVSATTAAVTPITPDWRKSDVLSSAWTPNDRHRRSLLGNGDGVSPSERPSLLSPLRLSLKKSDPSMMKIRVAIEEGESTDMSSPTAKASTILLVPCPLHQTLSWLMEEVAFRYHKNTAIRPKIHSLMTEQGASLFPDDLVSHVLQEHQLLKAIVSEWEYPSLVDHYATMCESMQIPSHSLLRDVLSQLTVHPTVIHLDAMGLETSVLRTVLPCLKRCMLSVRELTLSRNRLTDESLELLATFFSECVSSSLRVLDLSSNITSHMGLKRLVAVLPASMNMLDVSFNFVSDVAWMMASVDRLASPLFLSHLHLHHCQLTLEPLPLSFTIRAPEIFDLSYNPVSRRGLYGFFLSITEPERLSVLKLSGLYAFNTSVDAFPFALLSRFCQLKRLDLSNNSLSERDARDIASTLSSLPMLEHVDISMCHIENDHLTLIQQASAKNTLVLSHC